MMKIIISPAKKMKRDTDTLPYHGLPVFLNRAEQLKTYIRSLTYQEAKNLWKCNDRIAELNFERFAGMELEQNLTPALLAYEGIQYQYMAPAVFEDQSWEYVRNHLCILSGFYGVLKPFDGVVPYRLEMQAKLSVGGSRDLYDFWGDRLYKSLTGDDKVVINLASREYFRCIEKYVTPKDTFITVEFGELTGGKIRQKGTLAKMARGEMVRFLAESPKEIRKFCGLGFSYFEEGSAEDKYVFVKAGNPETQFG